MKSRIMAVDPGEKRLGLAISDPTQTIANPFTVLVHVARSEDALAIIKLADENEVCLIVVGQALDSEGEVGPSARKAQRLAEAIRSQTETPVVLWDEYASTQKARSAKIAMGVRKKKRIGHFDDIAATVILQSYLDAQHPD